MPWRVKYIFGVFTETSVLRFRMMRLLFSMGRISGGFSSSGHCAEYIADGSSVAVLHLSQMLNPRRLKGMQCFGECWDHGERKYREVHGTSKSWRPSYAPQGTSETSLNQFKQREYNFGVRRTWIYFSSFPSLPPFSPSWQQLFIKCLECVRLCTAHRESNVEPERHSSC